MYILGSHILHPETFSLEMAGRILNPRYNIDMPKEIYLIRHAEKDDKGTITEAGKEAAVALGKKLPRFQHVISSDSKRTQETALLITGREPIIDSRAGFYMANPEKSNGLNRISQERDIPFLEAVIVLNDSEVLAGVDGKADQLNALIKELFAEIPNGAKAIIVSHDLSISPAMRKRGLPLESIPFLSGYIIDESGKISAFMP